MHRVPPRPGGRIRLESRGGPRQTASTMRVRSLSTCLGPCRSLAAAAFLVAAAAGTAAAGLGDCSQPLSTGGGPNSADCLYVLKAAVGSRPCENCVCDTNGNNAITTTDALVCLKKAVGQSVSLNCPSCNGVTTTTVDVSTTSTSTTSTTTTLPVLCTGNADCSALPDAFRCNPNTGTCEKPCTKNADCHDFYECNTITGYCQEPALLF
jgi:hypothetical protein